MIDGDVSGEADFAFGAIIKSSVGEGLETVVADQFDRVGIGGDPVPIGEFQLGRGAGNLDLAGEGEGWAVRCSEDVCERVIIGAGGGKIGEGFGWGRKGWQNVQEVILLPEEQKRREREEGEGGAHGLVGEIKRALGCVDRIRWIYPKSDLVSGNFHQ